MSLPLFFTGRAIPVNSKLRRILIFVSLTLGLACLAYPVASNLIISAAQEKVAKENIVAVEQLPNEEIESLKAEALDYNDRLAKGMTYVSDPFDPDRPSIDSDEYARAMSVPGQEAMAVIRIPSLGIFVPIYHGTSEDVLKRGAGHLAGTSLPIGGTTSHCVVAGHTGLPSVKIFDRLEEIKKGEYIFFEALGETLCYKVTSIEIVEPQETDSLAMVNGKDLITLVTCTPYGINSHRLLVQGERCELPEEDVTAIENESPRWDVTLASVLPELILGLAAVTVLLFAVFSLRRRRQKSRNASQMCTDMGKRSAMQKHPAAQRHQPLASRKTGPPRKG